MMARKNVRTVLLSAVVAVTLIGARKAGASVLYNVTDLGVQPGSSGTFGEAFGINSGGTIVGTSSSAATGTPNQGFYYSGGVQTGVGSIKANSGSSATAISSTGEIVGTSVNNSSSIFQQAFYDVGGTLNNIGIFSGSGTSTASGVSAGGLVVGGATMKVGITSFTEAYLYNGSLQDLGQLSGTVANKGSKAFGINDSGLVVGNSSGFGVGATTHAFELNTGDGTTYNGNTLATAGVDLTTPFSNAAAAAGYGAFGTSVSSTAIADNANGDLVGNWNSGPTLFQSVFYSASTNTATDLGVLPGGGGGTYSFTTGINDLDQVVGYATTSSANTTDHAFLWTSGGGMVDLNSLIDPTSNPGGWVLTEALGINDSGDIVGYATDNAGATRAFLLTPVPEPATFSILGLGAAGLMMRRRK